MSKLNRSRSKEQLTGLPEEEYLPILEKISPADDDERQQYHRELLQYFIGGRKTADSLPLNVRPVLLPQAARPGMGFPFLYKHKSREVSSLGQVLQAAVADLLDAAEEEMQAQILASTAAFLQEHTASGPMPDYGFLIKALVEEVRAFAPQFEEAEAFDKQCDQLERHLLAEDASLIGFSARTPFQLLNLQLGQRKERHLQFLTILKKRIAGLKDILQLQGEESEHPPQHFQFAQDLVSFNKITSLTSSRASSKLPEARVRRLRQCLVTLTKARQSYLNKSSIVFTTQKLADEFDLQGTLTEAADRISENPCAEAKGYFEKEIREFVQVIAALRLAELEITYEYEEHLHEPYFQGFDRSYLKAEDIHYFRPLIVVADSQQLTQQPKDLLALLSDGDFIKVLAVNRLERLQAGREEAPLELAALAIFRRNAYVFQGGIDRAAALDESLRKGLEAPCPALWNVLIPKPGSAKGQSDYLALRAALDSRFFPALVYDVQSGEDFGGHFDISANPQPEQDFPSFELEIQAPKGIQRQAYPLTVADFLALSPDRAKMLEIVPPPYAHEKLIPLTEYLSLPPDSTTDKVPFIWTVDEQNRLRQAAVPVSWLRPCRSRLDYWNFLQELGGVRSNRLQQALTEATSGLEADKAAEIEGLKAQLQSEFERTRAEDLELSIRKILYALLETDVQIEDLLNQAGSPSPTVTPEAKAAEPPKETDQEEEKEEEAPAAPVSSEAWIESDLCTSCSDCINALPGVFKYNDERQAYVHNPRGDSYAKIVAAAEKCPAQCIHPGLPQDSSEKGLEKLVKRAEKYN